MIIYNVIKTDIREGDIVVFQGDGLLFKVLSTALAWFDPYYQSTPKPRKWHVGVISRYDLEDGWMVLEATGSGVQENPLYIYDPQYYQIYHWFDTVIDPVKRNEFLRNNLGKKYDSLAYVWVIIATLANRLLGLNIGRWQNNNMLCWEVLESFDEYMGKPMYKDYRTITISDILKALEG
jgi:hypothetical protein